MRKDVFICHTSADKFNIVRPLANALEQANISYWLDEAEIKWGDSLISKVNEGIRISKYVIVVLSAEFINRSWPERELNAALNLEASSGEVKILPLLSGDSTTRKKILEYYPLLNDKKNITWDNNPSEIIKELNQVLKSTSVIQEHANDLENNFNDIQIPNIKKNHSQRDKDKFLKESFDFIMKYFQKALSQIETKYDYIETDFTEIHKLKFVCKIYSQGNISNQCKIWIGGHLSSDSISYHDGYSIDINNDNTLNDYIGVVEQEGELKLELSNMGFMLSMPNETIVDMKGAAEYLWKRFISSLE